MYPLRVVLLTGEAREHRRTLEKTWGHSEIRPVEVAVLGLARVLEILLRNLRDPYRRSLGEAQGILCKRLDKDAAFDGSKHEKPGGSKLSLVFPHKSLRPVLY